MTVNFTSTATSVEYTQWYSITGAPALPSKTSWILIPASARFRFKDGELTSVNLYARRQLRDGSLGQDVFNVPGIYAFNEENWPEFLVNLYNVALVDYANNLKLEGEKVLQVDSDDDE